MKNNYANYYQISEQGKELIKELEGFKLDVYPDAEGYSVGYGHYLGKVKPPFTRITKENADAFFNADITRINTALNTKLTKRDLPQNVIDAAGSFAYNLGTGMYLTTLAEHLNKGHINEAAAYMKRIIYASGKKNETLIKRRAQEAALLLQGAGGSLMALLFFLLVVIAIFTFLKLKK